MDIKEIKPNEEEVNELIGLSRLWVEEGISYGIIEDSPEDILNKRVFVVKDDNRIVAYALVHETKAEIKNISSIIKDDENIIEIDSIYVLKEYRNKGIGKALFNYIEDNTDIDNIVLATSTKDYKRIFHFYIDELGMDFHSALLFKKAK